MSYVYKKKSPIREFSDDFIREKIQNSSFQEAWDQLLPLTKLGKSLGELKINNLQDLDFSKTNEDVVVTPRKTTSRKTAQDSSKKSQGSNKVQKKGRIEPSAKRQKHFQTDLSFQQSSSTIHGQKLMN